MLKVWPSQTNSSSVSGAGDSQELRSTDASAGVVRSRVCVMLGAAEHESHQSVTSSPESDSQEVNETLKSAQNRGARICHTK